MNSSQIERRQHHRSFFARENDIIARFTIPGNNQKPTIVKVLNLSVGGIFFAWRSHRSIDLKIGDEIMFEELRKGDHQILLLQVGARVVWVSEEFSLNFSGVGSKFIDISPDKQAGIDHFVKLCKDDSNLRFSSPQK